MDKNQLGKPTASPTLRWVFQCFLSIHLVTVSGHKQIANLTPERCWVLQFFGNQASKLNSTSVDAYINQGLTYYHFEQVKSE
ncbi:hypothetical protein SAMD00079811_77600 (plasmid) [Scytonema sp. HK-05]|nr:hypothetical protein NIES2130_09015 [Scytonema sp. HK-05]BAY50131.1 hypothetical protein SAMD00079811_77600 [Scytonema sp. HK-05]